MISKITGGTTQPLFSAKVLGQYDVTYHRCDQTGFIQTDTPTWLPQAYSEAITSLDLGLVRRGIQAAIVTQSLIARLGTRSDSLFLDYGGGYGLFTRLMRDIGLPFYTYDPHCKNLFAKGFEIDNFDSATRHYQWMTAWEVFEHLEDPQKTVGELLERTDYLLFSTILVPKQPLRSVDDWWYFAPETGQHISFYTTEALAYLARKSSCHFYSDGQAYHLFSRKHLSSDPFQSSLRERIKGRMERLLQYFLDRIAGISAERRFLNTLNQSVPLREADYATTLERIRKTEGERS